MDHLATTVDFFPTRPDLGPWVFEAWPEAAPAAERALWAEISRWLYDEIEQERHQTPTER